MSSPLRAFRKERKLTLDVVAEKVGVSSSQMSRIERFGTTSLDMAIKLAAYTELPVESFVKREAA